MHIIITLEELDNLKVLDLSVFVVNPSTNGYKEFIDFQYEVMTSGLIKLIDGRKNGRFNDIISHFGIVKKHSSPVYSDEIRLFGNEESAKEYSRIGLHKRAKEYAKVKQSLLCRDR